MTDVFPGTDELRMVWASAFMAGGVDEPVATDHLLAALSIAGSATGILEAAEVTPTVARFVVRQRRGNWASADEGGVGPSGPAELVMSEGGRPSPFTPAAAEAMRRATAASLSSGRSACGPGDVLLSLLADPGNRAVEMLTFCRVDVPALHQAVQTDAPYRAAERVGPELRRLRDVLLGRIRYERRGWYEWMTSVVTRSRVNYAAQPVVWVRLEAQEMAREHHHTDPRTDDLLLAVLGTYEVAEQYPHLQGQAAGRYDGGRALQRAGVSFHDAYQKTGTTDLGVDPRRLREYVPALPASTASLLHQVLWQQDNRATRLLSAIGVDVTQLELPIE